uniref:Octopamine receptor 2 n=1 Tax=Lymnaea stagnalis TaxID=6523 RepID=OAR2_LYMST|nr:RecName: Full=Octopamine receptor 2; Short=OA2 [Lymnaea stagnalis]AAB53033.1 octopamine receptor [Lymnaea stagnalis]
MMSFPIALFADVNQSFRANLVVSSYHHAITFPTVRGANFSTFFPRNFSVSADVWLCGANFSQEWQLMQPVCSTKYDSITIFITVAVVLTLITLWTILGNFFVLMALYRYGTLRTMSNCLIGNLAISDLLLAVTVLPISTVHDLLGYWVFGEFTCTLWLCMDVLYCTASIWGLCTVAFDRYLATVYPVWYHDQRSVRKAVGCIVFVWIFSIVISFAPFIGWQHMIPSFFSFNASIQRYQCILFTSSSYVLYSSMGSFVIPAILMAFMYVRIFVVLHNQSRGVKFKSGLKISSSKYNGCPVINEPSREGINGLGRDVTNTTLLSDAVGSSADLTSNGKDDPRVLATAPIELTEDVPPLNGHHHRTVHETPYVSGLHTKRSNSFALPTELEKKCKPLTNNILHMMDFDRRNSHNAVIQRSASEMVNLDVSKHELLISNVCHRSKSATALTSETGDPLGSLAGPRRSLQCNVGGLVRNKHMTLSMKRRFELREQRATKRMLLIMACFCVCWMPFLFMYILRSVCDTCHMNQHFVAAIIWLGYVNSSLNPVLYTLFNDDFKVAFKRLIGARSPSAYRSPGPRR